MQSKKRPKRALLLFRVIFRPANRSKSFKAGDDHVIVAAGAVDDEQITVSAPAAHDAHMGVLWVNTRSPGIASSQEMAVQ